MEISGLKSRSHQRKEKDLFHVIHKVPSGDGPYVRAKHAQVCLFFFVFSSFTACRMCIEVISVHGICHLFLFLLLVD